MKSEGIKGGLLKIHKGWSKSYIYIYIYMGVSKNRGTPKWMVKIMENPIKMDDLGVHLFSETPSLKLT